MRVLAGILVALGLVVCGAAAFAAGSPPSKAVPVETAKATTGVTPESILGEPYMLTWDKDVRFKGRRPFQTVLHSMDGQARKVEKFSRPRTPSQETAFIIKAESYVEEASDALDNGDFNLAKERIATVTRMAAVDLITQSAKDRMAAVAADLAKVQKRFSAMRARAALGQALKLAGRMQAYFDNDRYGEVVSLYQDIQQLDNEEGLKNPEVAGTAAALLDKCAALSRRAQLHLDFSQMKLKVDAVSCFPEGKSFAIISGEVIGEGGTVAPDLTVSCVTGRRVTFDFKGEKIALELEQ